MLGRNGEMNPRDASGRSIGRTFDQMLLDGLAGPFGISVERDQPLGFAAVVEPLLHNSADNRTIVGPGRQYGFQLGPESELFDVVKQRVDAFAAFTVVDELE